MKLYIDTSDSENIVVKLGGEVLESSARKGKSQILLTVIEAALKERGLLLNSITEIEVNAGPGSFTGLRVGISVANVLGWSLGVPVNGRDVKSNGPLEPIYDIYRIGTFKS